MNNDDDYISITNTFSIHAIITFIIITFISQSPLLSSLVSLSLMLIKMDTRIKKNSNNNYNKKHPRKASNQLTVREANSWRRPAFDAELGGTVRHDIVPPHIAQDGRHAHDMSAAEVDHVGQELSRHLARGGRQWTAVCEAWFNEQCRLSCVGMTGWEQW